MEKITTDISSFENLRKDGYTYVDKTDLLWRLVAAKSLAELTEKAAALKRSIDRAVWSLKKRNGWG